MVGYVIGGILAAALLVMAVHLLRQRKRLSRLAEQMGNGDLFSAEMLITGEHAVDVFVHVTPENGEPYAPDSELATTDDAIKTAFSLLGINTNTTGKTN